MADPRKRQVFDGLHARYATYAIDNSTITYSATTAGGSAQAGLAVTLSADGTVGLIGDGEALEGKLIEVYADNFAKVQVGGFCTLPGGSGASLTRGKAVVGDLGSNSAEGYIREVATATAAELGVQRGRLVEVGTATAVVVDLG